LDQTCLRLCGILLAWRDSAASVNSIMFAVDVERGLMGFQATSSITAATFTNQPSWKATF